MLRYDDQAVMYDDAKEIQVLWNTSPLETTTNHSQHTRTNSETITEYSLGTNPLMNLAQLQEHFQQLQDITTATNHNGSTVPKLQDCGRTPIHSNAVLLCGTMCHTATNKPHHIFISRHPHI